ncbi:hypothetical protein H0H81_007756 [Sphagnurus paluster]|uniref:Argonaute-like protein n=1 Tax=Sphagnurus paluster TaxID=117069 RepID=A0A9P7GR85_9AGAR|nr:hypothetical protein H0H81_007756 [Sphagnurus paluster]
MPPRIAPERGAPRGGRGGGRPPRGARGGGAGRGASPVGLPSIGANVQTVGVKRPGYGTAGRPIAVRTNSYVTSIPEEIIRHYDTITPSNLPVRMNFMLIKKLQHEVAANIFTPAAVYDGRKNMFSTRNLALGNTNSREVCIFHISVQSANPVHWKFDVTLSPPGRPAGDRPPKVYKIKVTKVNEINPEVLHQFVRGQYSSNDNMVLTAIMALNVVIRMEPSEKFPFNTRSFYTDRETKDIGNGIVLWRGYFQSVRPGIGRMLINVDISTGMMYKPGPLLDLCLEFFGMREPGKLAPARGFPDRERLRLQRFLSGLRIITPHTAAGKPPIPRVIKKLSTAGADAISFPLRDGTTTTVAQYFQSIQNRALRFPGVVCVEVGTGALLPLEVCQVPAGQIMKKQLPPEKTKDVLDFATKKPVERFRSIENGLGLLAYGQSEYVRQFGMTVDTQAGPLPIQARILAPPTLKYGPGSKQPTITPRDGAWNMIDKRFIKAETIERWIVVVYERRDRFTDQDAGEMVRGLISGCRSVGITVQEENPLVKWENGQGNIANQLRAAGGECARKNGGRGGPTLIVVVLPDHGNDIYTAVKQQMGVATQCLKSLKCRRAKPQYWANVCLKINPKLGGINTIPDAKSVPVLSDPHTPTIVMGADVIHPAPGTEGRPSFTSVVGNVDSDTAKYIATTSVQKSRQEMIDDLEAMCTKILKMYIGYRGSVEKKPAPAPKRLLFFRDGVSEGQFQQVLDLELPMIKAACAALKIEPKITVIVVGKRHHVRFVAQDGKDTDRSGNCPAGTIVDREIGHPTEFDFFLQSHGGLLGTSRPAHYTVLYDENGFSADSMQALAFALCHVYARATRSVSIPAPVYYADIVCSRAKNHYDPAGNLDLSETGTHTGSEANVILEAFKTAYKPLHENTSRVMYFSASGITPTTVAARRAAARREEQPIAGPSGTRGDDEDVEMADPDANNDAQEREPPRRRARGRQAATVDYDSEELDDPQEEMTTKKRKLSKAAEAKLKTKPKKKNEDEDYDGRDDDDPYRALSKTWGGRGNAVSTPKPPVGNFENCAKCEKQFTVTKYTMAAVPGPGFLCHRCAKDSGNDPFKKPAAPKRKKVPAEKRTIVNFEERRFPTLATMCIQLVTKHIDDVEALGDIGAINMDSISKALSKNRGLTPQNAHLFYNVTNSTLTLYDATNLPSPALTTLIHLNPNLTSLRLDFCGHLDDTCMATLSDALPALNSLELLGPFLVRPSAWIKFFTSHPTMITFKITQSPRFDLECMQALATYCSETLVALRLRELGLLNNDFLTILHGFPHLAELDLSDPGNPDACSAEALEELLKAVAGSGLRKLDLSRHILLDDSVLRQGLAGSHGLETLALRNTPALTDVGVAAFFGDWENAPLRSLDMSRNHDLGTNALIALLRHSGKQLEVLEINGWGGVTEEALKMVGRLGGELKKLDVGKGSLFMA